jgi:hypothetical protein
MTLQPAAIKNLHRREAATNSAKNVAKIVGIGATLLGIGVVMGVMQANHNESTPQSYDPYRSRLKKVLLGR